MKTAVAFSALIAGASAFAPATHFTSSALKATADYDGMVGGDSYETGGKMFDPMNLAEWIPPEHARKAELSNGRSAMLATVGWFFPAKVFHFAGDVSLEDPIKAISDSDPQWWAQWILICGLFEGIKYRGEMEGKSYTGDGDPVVDYTNNWGKLSAPEKEEMRLKELKNGRLAMIGVASFVSAHFLPGSVPALPADFV